MGGWVTINVTENVIKKRNEKVYFVFGSISSSAPNINQIFKALIDNEKIHADCLRKVETSTTENGPSCFCKNYVAV